MALLGTFLSMFSKPTSLLLHCVLFYYNSAGVIAGAQHAIDVTRSLIDAVHLTLTDTH